MEGLQIRRRQGARVRLEDGFFFCYTEAYLGSRARLRRAKQAVTDL